MKKVVINFWDNNIVRDSYLEASLLCGGGPMRKPELVEYIRHQNNWDGITIFTDNFIHMAPQVNSKYKVAWLMEPREFNQKPYYQILDFEKYYDLILTYEKTLLSRGSKYCRIPADFTVIEKDVFSYTHPKTKLCSMTYSHKRFMSGHKLRHEIAEDPFFTGKIDYYGSGSPNPFNLKSITLLNYCFQVVIENSIDENYFTEKISDCFVTGVVPVFWGCPNIGDFFDKDGIICFNNKDELKKIFESGIISLDFFNQEKVQKAIKENYHNAIENYTESDDIIYKTICRELKI